MRATSIHDGPAQQAVTRLYAHLWDELDELSHEDQLQLTTHDSVDVRSGLAGIQCLTEDVIDLLLEDADTRVLVALMTNESLQSTSRISLQVADRHVAGDLPGAADERRPAHLRHLSEAGQLRVLDTPQHVDDEIIDMLVGTRHRSVRVRALELLDPIQLHTVAVRSVFDERWDSDLLWRMLDVNRLTPRHAANAARFLDFTEAPVGAVEFFRELKDVRVQQLLVINGTWTLSARQLVPALMVDERGQEFLDQHRPQETDTWDALLSNWEGNLEDLLIACEELGREVTP